MRKLLYYIIGIIVPAFFVACSDDDGNLRPSSQDENWWVNYDNPDDPLDHLIYEVYSQYGVAIFYNDTVGLQDRDVDAFGNPNVYYEVIKLNYGILGGATDAEAATYALSYNKDEITDGVELLRDYVLPNLPDFVPAPKSYLLVDTLRLGILNPALQIPYAGSAYAGMTTVAVGKLGMIKTMTEEEKKMFGGEILAAPVASTVYDDYTTTLTPGFYKEVQKLGPGYWGYGNKVDINNTSSFYPKYAHWYEYGFLKPALDKEFREDALYYFPNKEQDVADFVALCLGFTEAEVLTTYGMYEHIINKYYFMMEIFDLLKKDNSKK
ncbi:hypothetical protein [Butyricimonas synergistica]|uniref:hypothetical protein n=1 Tax=Butyricimonas synergistica TaxID=544644 RepID=UPI000365C676|nr:hypothetical protein [Butyricimonas synergistica]